MTDDRKVILMIIPHYGYGGAQRVFTQLVNHFSAQYQVVEVTFDQDFEDVYQSHGIKETLAVTAGSNLVVKTIRFVQRSLRLSRLKFKYRPVLSISHLEGANFVNAISPGPGKTVLCIHGSRTAFDSNRRGFVRFVENKILTPVLYNIVNQIVCVSSEIREELISYYNVRKSLLKVITNGIDYHGIVQKATEPIAQKYDKVFKREVVVFCGRLAPQKNPLVLLDIIHEALKTRDFNLLIIGDGPMLDDMKHRCSILNLDFIDINEGQFDSSEARVYFTGFQQNPFALMKRSSVFILTSDFEGYPLIVCEALACGLPVIATDCPTGVREILSDKVVERKPISDSEFETFGVLMPLVNRFSTDFSVRIQLWSNLLIKVLDDSVLKSAYAQRAKERAATLDVKYFFYKWDCLLNELQ